MDLANKPLKYFLYARKSSEDDDRQILSIQSQIDEAKKRFSELNIVEVLSESASAHKPNNRPVFARMMERILNGEADGIIAWHPDRLSRNPLDAAQIVYSLDSGLIKDLKFTAFTFENSPEGKMLLNIMLGQSKYFSDKLSKDIKRGNMAKLRSGLLPGKAPQGYQNIRVDGGQKLVVPKEPEFSLLVKSWDLLLTGVYTVPMILKKLNNEWGYRTPNGYQMNRSVLYSIFTNPFYAGRIVRREGDFEGKHEKMISWENFERAQEILGRPGKPRPSKNVVPFAGMIKCGECDCHLSADVKEQCYCPKCHRKFTLTHKNKNCPVCGVNAFANEMKLLNYTYYRCSHAKPERHCGQKPIRSTELEKQIDEYLQSIYLPQEFSQWAIKWLKFSHEKEVVDHTMQLQMLQKTYEQLQNKIDRLVEMRLNDQISSEQYDAKKSELNIEKISLGEQMAGYEHRVSRWVELTENTFDFITQAPERFNNGSIEDKRLILATVGANLSFLDGKLQIEAKRPFELVRDTVKTLRNKKTTLEPNYMSDVSMQNASSHPVLNQLCWDQDSNLGRLAPMVLQTIPIVHSGIPAC